MHGSTKHAWGRRVSRRCCLDHLQPGDRWRAALHHRPRNAESRHWLPTPGNPKAVCPANSGGAYRTVVGETGKWWSATVSALSVGRRPRWSSMMMLSRWRTDVTGIMEHDRHSVAWSRLTISSWISKTSPLKRGINLRGTQQMAPASDSVNPDADPVSPEHHLNQEHPGARWAPWRLLGHELKKKEEKKRPTHRSW